MGLSDYAYGAGSLLTGGLVSPDAMRTAFGGAKDDPELVRRQKMLSGELEAAALGAKPSAAELAGGRAADQAVATQYSLAASQPGLSPAAAARQASIGAAGAQQDIAGQMAALRAQEQERARMAWMQMLQQQRAADLARSQANAAALGGTLGAIGQSAAAGA